MDSVHLTGNAHGDVVPHPSRLPEVIPTAGAKSGILGQIGSLQVRLAQTAEEVAAAQALRFHVFVQELGAEAPPFSIGDNLDADAFDAICDHLLVIDSSAEEGVPNQIVGTYRLLPEERASNGFYSDSEFELSRLVERHPSRRFLELGRSCVLPAYRSKRTIELLWQGIWNYCRQGEIDVMVGCASFPGTEPAAHAQALSFLAHHASSEAEWHVRARGERYCAMDLMPREMIDMKSALMATPPLIKGYLRLGARFGEGCVIDHEFNTTDVLVILPVEFIPSRYLAYYGSDDKPETT